MVERSSQADLLKIFHQLQNDLIQKKTDTLKKYVVISQRVNVISPTSDFFNCYLAAQRPTLGHYLGGSLTHPMLITAILPI